MRALWDGLLELLQMVGEMFVLVAFLGTLLATVWLVGVAIGAAP